MEKTRPAILFRAEVYHSTWKTETASLYRLYIVHCIHCILYTLYIVYTVPCIHCLLYTLYILYTVYILHYMHCTLYTVSRSDCYLRLVLPFWRDAQHRKPRASLSVSPWYLSCPSRECLQEEAGEMHCTAKAGQGCWAWNPQGQESLRSFGPIILQSPGARECLQCSSIPIVEMIKRDRNTHSSEQSNFQEIDQHEWLQSPGPFV